MFWPFYAHLSEYIISWYSSGLPARPDRTATGAELAAVLFDQGGVAAFLAHLAGDRFECGRF